MATARAFASFYAFFYNVPATTEIYTLSLHDALPISARPASDIGSTGRAASPATSGRDDDVDTTRSEEHTSELQSRQYLVCRLLLEKKNGKLLSRRGPASAPRPQGRPAAITHHGRRGA